MDLPNKNNEGYRMPSNHLIDSRASLIGGMLPTEEGYIVPDGYMSGSRAAIIRRTTPSTTAVRTLSRWAAVAAVIVLLASVTAVWTSTGTSGETVTLASVSDEAMASYLELHLESVDIDDLVNYEVLDLETIDRIDILEPIEVDDYLYYRLDEIDIDLINEYL